MDIPGIPFNADEVREGLRLAMNVGLPTEEIDRPIFVFVAPPVDNAEARDADGVPFDWQATVTRPIPDRRVPVPCAIEAADSGVMISNFGPMMPSRVVLTLLDEDYELVKGFDYVELGQNKYYRKETKPPLGLISVGIYQVLCQSDDEG